MKNRIMKKICMVMMALALTTGSVCAAGVITGIQTEAASVNSNLKKITASVINSKTKESDSEKKKLQKLFNYVEAKCKYGRSTDVPGSKNWDKTAAYNMLKKKKGNCYNDAAAFAYLAKQSTDYSVRIAAGKTNAYGNKNQPHAWAEVKIGKTWYVCDTNMDRALKKSSGKLFLKKRDSSSIKKIYNNYKGVKYTTVKKL